MAGNTLIIMLIFRVYDSSVGADSFKEALRMGVETFHSLKKVLTKKDIIPQVWAMKEVLHQI